MEESDVGRVLAAAAPEPDAVPLIRDLSGRARARGRRLRMRRNVLTGGGTGVAIAAVVGMVAALGGFGGGSAPEAAGQAAGGQYSGTRTPTPSATSPVAPTGTSSGTAGSSNLSGPAGSSKVFSPSGLPSLHTGTPSMAKWTNYPDKDATLTAAVKAALPSADQYQFKLYRSGGNSRSYGAEFTWGAGSQEVVLDVGVAAISPNPPPGTPSMCQTDPKHCTTGSATLQGHPVTWQFYNGDQSGPTLDITDSQALVSYDLSVSGPTAPHLPGMSVMKGVGLNDQVISALLSAWPRQLAP